MKCKGTIFSPYLLAPHENFQLLRSFNLIVLAFHFAEFAVFGDEFQELAELAVLEWQRRLRVTQLILRLALAGKRIYLIVNG